jgi:hypothetical protein
MQASRSKLEIGIVLGLILLGVLIAGSSNEFLVSAFGVSLLFFGGALYLWQQR